MTQDRINQFAKVPQALVDRCTPFGVAQAEVDRLSDRKFDLTLSSEDFQFDSDLRLPDGYGLTPHGLNSVCRFTDVPGPMASYLRDRGLNSELAEHLTREYGQMTDSDRANKRAVRRFIARFVQTDRETQLRGLFSDSYGALDNADIMHMIAGALGDQQAILSHWSHDGDDIVASGFVDGGWRVEVDSEYGVGFCLRNSEVGRLAFDLCPYVFRGACANGLVYGRRDGVRVTRKHSGRIDLVATAEAIRESMEDCVARGHRVLDQFLAIRDVRVKDARRVLVAIAREQRLTKDQTRGILTAWEHEPDSSGQGVVNAITRSAKAYEGVERLAVEAVGGLALSPGLASDLAGIERHWARLENRAESVSDSELEAILRV